MGQTQADDIDKVRYYWAYNMPCALLINNEAFWTSTLKPIYDLLYKDVLLNIRTAMAAGFKEVIQLVDLNKMDLSLKTYFVTVLEHFLDDKEAKINQLVLPTICSLVNGRDWAKRPPNSADSGSNQLPSMPLWASKQGLAHMPTGEVSPLEK